MSRENKGFISDLCREHNVHLYQALIIRDIPDRFNLTCSIYLNSLDDNKKLNAVLKALPQVFCTDTIRFSNQQTRKTKHLCELPYFKGYEDVVEQCYRNLNSEDKNG
jgi:hypothetical protein